jgi:hypothetical protein
MPMMLFHHHLRSELDAWASAGLMAKFWWRDDDAISDTPQLQRLLGIAGDAGVVVGLGIVPERATSSLIGLAATGRCCFWQHGWGHRFYTAGEFGEERAIELMVRDAYLGQQALDSLLGRDGWQRVFVPPNHMLSVPFKSLVPGLGYLGLSAGVPLTPRLAHVVEVNAEVDVMDWPNKRLLSESAICDMLVEQLRQRRGGAVPVDRPVGILTHHLVLDDGAWDLIRRLVATLHAHRAVDLVPADSLFMGKPDSSSESAAHRRPGGTRPTETPNITVVLTSCGRPDLLARTLDSFFQYNTCPIREFLLMEDGEGVSELSNDERYRRHDIRWLCTGRRIRQMRSVDLLYGLVETEYLFHCQDDWEFYAPGFIERSMIVLEHRPNILQVWIRALDDTNGHPVTKQTFEADGVPYRFMQPGFDSGEWGTWHGFSFNPGLRRRSDMSLIGSFAGLAPAETRPSWEIESQASEFFLRQGFLAAILADRDGTGYVRHIGWGRRVGDPAHA